MSGFVHPLSDVQTKAIGDGTKIWQFCVVLPDAQIGRNCNICSHCFIENEVVIGDRVTVKCGVQLWDGVTVESDVCIGANATFTNDLYPRSKNAAWIKQPTRICAGASIGANATILCGITVGAGAMIGAGSVVTKDVPPGEVWTGNPARFLRKTNEEQSC